MKKTILLSLCLMLMLAGCKSNDSSELLQSVPKDTGFLLVANMGRMQEKIGRDISLVDTELANISSSSSPFGSIMKVVLDPESGVDFKLPLVAFERKYAPVVTFMLADKGDFEKALASEAAIKLIDSGGIKKSADNTVFISESQAWVTTGYPELSDDDIKLFKALGEKESILSLRHIEGFADSADDISLLCSLSFLWGSGMQNPSYMLGLNMLFDSPKYVAAHVNFDKGEINGNLSILNSKGDTSECAIKPVNIDIKSLKNFQGKGNIFFAMGVDPAIMAQVAAGLKNLPIVPRDAIEALGSLNGNVLLAVDMNNEEPGASLSLDFDNERAAENGRKLVASFLPEDHIEMSVSGETLSAIYIGAKGGLSMSEVASKFEGADIGVVAVNTQSFGIREAEIVKGLSFTGKSKGNVMEFDFTVETDPAQNSLVTILGSLILCKWK